MDNNNRFYCMNTSELFDETAAIYKKSFKSLIGASLIWTLITLLVAIIFVVFITVSTFASAKANGVGGAVIVFLTFLALSIVISIVGFGNIAVTMDITRGTFAGENISIAKSFNKAFSSIPQFLSLAAALIITYIPCIIFIVLLFIPVLGISEYDGDIFKLGFTGLLFFLAYIIMAFVLYAITVFALPAAVFDKMHFFKAISRSFGLVKKDFKKISFSLILFQLVFMAIYYSFYGIFAIASAVTQTSANFISAGNLPYFYALSSLGGLVGFAINVLTTPFQGIFIYMLYCNQKIKYEGFDIEVSLDRCENS